MRYTTVLFDADGTLLDFHRSEAEALTEAMTLNGILPSKERTELYSKINDSLWKLLERGEIEKQVLFYRRFELFFEALDVSGDAKKMASDYMSILSTKGYMLDGAAEMCQRLFGKVKLYIVTNGVEFIQRGRYARCGMEKWFENVFISDVIGAEKPSLKFFEYVFEHIDGIDKEKTLLVGDSLTADIRGGNDFGIATCWYAPNAELLPSDTVPTYIAHSFDEVERCIAYGDLK